MIDYIEVYTKMFETEEGFITAAEVDAEHDRIVFTTKRSTKIVYGLRDFNNLMAKKKITSNN